MKKLVFLVVIAAAIGSHAAKFETCMNEVRKECGSRLAKFANFKVDGTDCKIVQGGEREVYPNTRYGTKVVFKDDNTMLSIITSPGGNVPACSVREVNIRGVFKKDKASEGRLFAVTSAGNIIVITRNQTVQYLTNKNGDPLQNVTDLKIDDKADLVEIYFNGNKNVESATKYTLKQVLDKLNKASLAECVPGGCT